MNNLFYDHYKIDQVLTFALSLNGI